MTWITRKNGLKIYLSKDNHSVKAQANCNGRTFKGFGYDAETAINDLMLNIETELDS